MVFRLNTYGPRQWSGIFSVIPFSDLVEDGHAIESFNIMQSVDSTEILTNIDPYPNEIHPILTNDINGERTDLTNRWLLIEVKFNQNKEKTN